MNLHLVTRAGRPFGASRAGQALRLLFGCPRRRSAVCGLVYRTGGWADRREPLLREMPVEGEALAHVEATHHLEACAVDEAQLTTLGDEQSLDRAMNPAWRPR